MVVDLLGFVSGLPVHVLSFGLMGEFDPFGIDGLVVLATLLALILVVATRKTEPRNDKSTSQNEQVVDQAFLVRSVPVVTSPSAIAPALSVTSRSPVIDDSETLQFASFPSMVQPVDSVPKRRLRAHSRLLALPDLVTTRAGLRTAPIAALTLAVGLISVWSGQRALIGVDPGASSFVVWFAGLFVLVLVCNQADRRMPTAYSRTDTRSGFSGMRVAVLFGIIVVISLYIWQAAPNRAADDSSLDLTLLWFVTIVALIVAAAGPPRREHVARLRAWAHRVRGDILITVLVAVIAIVPRIYHLSSYPWAMSGDEGTFAVTARSVLHGELSNPFTSGPWGYPSLLFIFQGRLMNLTGETVSGARMLSAVLGTASVVAIYWLARHHFGRWTGLIAGVIAATFNFHVFWSRNAQNAIAPMFFVPLALLFLDRGLIGRSRIDSLAAGLVIGFAQFFHPSNRILFPIAAAYAVYALLYRFTKSRAQLVRDGGLLVPNVLWVAAGAIVGHLPLLAYFNTYREAFSDRTNQVSVFASGWLAREQEIVGKSAVEILWIQFRNAALLPFNTNTGGHFHPEVPFASWPLVVPLAIGMAMVTATFWRRSSFGLAIAFWATVVGLALTHGSPQTNRYTSSGPFLAIFAAIGIVAIAHVMIRLVRLPRIPVAALAAAVTLLIAGWHLNWYFEEPNPVAISSDANTQIANRLAHEAAMYGAGLTVYLSGTPRLNYVGFANILYIAPDANGIDVDQPWTADGSMPELTGPTLFAFVPERLGELDVVRDWFPSGTITVSTLPDGEKILTTYLVGAPDLDLARGPIVLVIR